VDGQARRHPGVIATEVFSPVSLIDAISITDWESKS